MDKISRWKLADELTVYQIALLISGYDPSEFENDDSDRWPNEVKQEISPYLNAIKNAAKSKKIEMTPVHFEGGYNGGDVIDWTNSTIDVASLCEWMHRRNFEDGFFSRRRTRWTNVLTGRASSTPQNLQRQCEHRMRLQLIRQH